MEDPVREIPHVISLLTETPPSLQQKAIDKYFTLDARFTHPFCRTGSSPNSRYLISRIYRWYKIMSPRISAKITSISFDEENMVLYVGMTQVFAIWAIPTHRSEVSLVTVLHLTREFPSRRSIGGGEEDGERVVGELTKKSDDGSGKGPYYITSQNDLYQTDQFVKFVLPWFSILVPLWQIVATLFCVVGSYLLYPVTWYEENYQEQFRRKELPPKWNDGR